MIKLKSAIIRFLFFVSGFIGIFSLIPMIYFYGQGIKISDDFWDTLIPGVDKKTEFEKLMSNFHI